MDIVDVIKWEISDKELVHKFSSDNLRLGSQLVVYPGQTAFFVKGGKFFDEFKSGTYTIKSENIPLIGKLINLPFNGETPFKAEVWYVNQVALLDCKWGTSTPMQIEDPKYEVIIPVRAYGQYGFRIVNPRTFLERLVGNMSSFATSKVTDFFRGVILSKLTAIIYEKLKVDDVSTLNINTYLDSLSNYSKDRMAEIFLSYGIELELFNIMAISIVETDPSFQRLKAAKDAAAKIKIIGRSDYQMTRSFDVLEKAAQNEGSGVMGAAVGIGAGVGLGNVVGAMAAHTIQTNAQDPDTPPAIPAAVYYLAVDGERQGPFNATTIENKITRGEISDNVLIWKKGMTVWANITSMDEFAHLFEENCPPPIPEM